MKRLLSITAFSLMLATGISVPQAFAQSVNESLEARVHPQVSRPSSTQPSTTLTQPSSVNNATPQAQNASPTTRSLDKSAIKQQKTQHIPGYCNLPTGSSKDSFEYGEAVYLCKYGS